MTAEDRKIVAEGKELSDKHMNFAQSLMKQQFTDTPIKGFVSTLIFSNKRSVNFTTGGPVIQIVHTRGNHWIVATTDGITNKIFVYDSLYSSIDICTEELIAENFGMAHIEVVLDAPKQKGPMDCGAFAIAVCILLAHHYSQHQPLKLSFNQDLMRDHLIECFTKKCIKLFPLA